MPPPRRVVTQLRGFFRAYEASEADAAHFRARQLGAMLRLTPAAMACNAVNALVVGCFLWREVEPEPLVAWVAAVLALATLGLRGWWRNARSTPRPRASRRALRRATIQATLLAAVWGFLPAFFMPLVGAASQLFISVVTTGLVCAGGFALASVPSAGTAWVGVLGTCGAVALSRSTLTDGPGFGFMLGAYSVIVVAAIWNIAQTLGARLVAELRADRQNEVIGLLLRDFEDTATDLLWELDSDGRFTHVSARLAAVLAATDERLARTHASRLLARFVPRDEAQRAGWATLRARFTGGEPFRDLVVAMRDGGEVRWWSLSARPVRAADGETVGWRGVAADVTDKHLAVRRLEWLAHNDALTGLVNRTQFRELLRALLEPVGEPPSPFAVMALDLDGFKQVNDTRGHAAGDELLQAFGQRLLAVTRRTDTVARLGGDEFAILLRGHRAAEDLRQVVTRVAEQILAPDSRGMGVALLDGVVVRASIGVAVAPKDGENVDTLMNHADIALYAAKHSGGSRVRFFQHEMAEVERRRAALERGLRGAIARNELRLQYQPQVALRDGRVVGFEALLRWTNPELGSVSPAEFVPIAEEAGLMQEIGAWVTKEACREAASWPDDLRLSVNVAAPELNSPTFVQQVVDLTSALPPRRVELEVTESALIGDTAAAVRTLNTLRGMGFAIALDDFGTGYSALGYLRHFAFDTLKIDRSFVRDFVQDGEAQVIIETILAMADALGMTTIAEGVETEQEAALLRERGCAMMQGYLVERPLASEDVVPFVARWEPRREALFGPRLAADGEEKRPRAATIRRRRGA